jgi:transcriptional regulator with XRE-family HTH domain
MQQVGPTMRKRRLGSELRKLREVAGVAAERAAAELDCNVSKIRHVEGGRNAPSKSDLKALCELYGASANVHAVLEDIRKGASKPGWWSTYRLPRWLNAYVGAESDARTVSTFGLELIPGLLQTEAYARAVHEVVGIANPEKVVKARVKRQERLSEEIPLTLNAVVSEGAIRRAAGADFAKEQFQHLLDMAAKPNVSLRILPFSAGLHTSMSGGFTLLEFDPEVGQPTGYLEYVGAGQLVDDPDIVRSMAARFAGLQGQAASEEDTADFISEWT